MNNKAEQDPEMHPLRTQFVEPNQHNPDQEPTPEVIERTIILFERQKAYNAIQQSVNWEQWLEENGILSEEDQQNMQKLTDILSSLYHVKDRKLDYKLLALPFLKNSKDEDDTHRRLILFFKAYKIARYWEDTR